MKTISPAGTPGYDGVTQPAELGSRQNREKCGSTDKGLKGLEVNDLIKAVHSFIEGLEWEAQTPYAQGPAKGVRTIPI